MDALGDVIVGSWTGASSTIRAKRTVFLEDVLSDISEVILQLGSDIVEQRDDVQVAQVVLLYRVSALALTISTNELLVESSEEERWVFVWQPCRQSLKAGGRTCPDSHDFSHIEL
jgi:hypothetical protein